MEIVFIYIKEFNSLKDQNINFGSEYKFKYLKDSNTLTAIKNELCISEFYNISDNGATITNVSTIIGKNGTGKSSILEFITKNISAGLNLQNEMLLVYKSENEFKLIATQEIVNKTAVINEIKILKKQTIGDQSEPFIMDFGYDFRGFPNTDLIYFSNIFDGAPEEHRSGFYNISTNFLIFDDHNSARLQGTILGNNGNQVGVHLIEDIFRQVRFLTDKISKNKLRFKLPETLDISINMEYLLNDSVFARNSNLKEQFQLFRRNLENDYDYGVSDDVFATVKGFITYILLNFIKELLSIAPPGKEFPFTFEYSHEFHLSPEEIPFSKYPFQKAVEMFFEVTEKKIKENTITVGLAESLLNNTKEFVQFIFDNGGRFKHSYFGKEREPSVAIDIREKELLDRFFSLYLKTFSVNPYLKFIWRKLSSGERALLNIYSRFFSLSDEHKFGNKLSRNIIILIDEGDVYLHPSWQKKFVKNILEYLPVIFDQDEHGRKRNIQIIFTTNSPIPASDILNYNTIFLDKVIVEDNGSYDYTVIVKDSLNDQKDNFAANIHTLLSDSFFVRNGLIGDFASGKINELITNLTHRKKFTPEETTNMRLLIHQIGEPIIKHKLMQLYNDRYNLDIYERLDRIEKRLGE